uniref:Uncharacterized protein n=1 Tax=uncultured prokaryote TaxID=198431 RepID=A0A0H5Q527_9ZZZZ|nr:hypothetical protein [uncultured prokaryote]
MTFTRPFWRLSFLHIITGTDETAQCDLNVTSTDIDTGLVPDADYGTAAELAYRTMIQGLSGQRAAYSAFTAVKVAPIKVDGHYAGEPFLTPALNPAVGVNPTVVPQASIALTTWTGSTLGKGNYGRMFLPHSGVPDASTPLLSTTLAGNVADAFATFITAINAIPDGGVATIMSQPSLITTWPGSAKPVTQVRVGRVVDTQRRRRASLDESYQSRPV